MCPLFFILLYGCVCHPLINGYDDDDDGDVVAHVKEPFLAFLLKYSEMLVVMPDYNDKTVILANATITFSSCALLCNNGLKRKRGASFFVGSRLQNTALTTVQCVV